MNPNPPLLLLTAYAPWQAVAYQALIRMRVPARPVALGGIQPQLVRFPITHAQFARKGQCLEMEHPRAQHARNILTQLSLDLPIAHIAGLLGFPWPLVQVVQMYVSYAQSVVFSIILLRLDVSRVVLGHRTTLRVSAPPALVGPLPVTEL